MNIHSGLMPARACGVGLSVNQPLNGAHSQWLEIDSLPSGEPSLSFHLPDFFACLIPSTQTFFT
jgi:hypothetical protein